MIYILVALEDELKFNPNPNKYTIVYSGVGKINAAYTATRIALRNDCDLIVNYGTAGTFDRSAIGQLISIGTVKQRDVDARPLSPLGTTPFDKVADISVDKFSTWTLSTGDNFITSPPELDSDLVDMEAYAIAKVCKKLMMPFKCYKYVTDLADENAANDWQSNVSKGEKEFWKIFNS